MSKLKTNELKYYLDKEEGRKEKPKKKVTSIYKKGNNRQSNG
jgi:hypothetical protein